MNKTYDILAPDGKTILHRGILNASCVRKFSLMEEDSITLSFSLRDAVGFPVGSSCGDFLICRKQEGTWNAATGVWDYKLKFDACYWAWANKILRYIIPGVDSAKETSFTLTATIDIHAAVIKNCLDFLGIKYGGSPFRVDTTDTSLAQEARLVRYENLSVLGGIQAIAEAFECEWWVDRNAVYFGRCENKETDFRFEAGVNVSSVSFAQGESEAPNRLYVYGSERNLPADYRKTDGNDTIGGVVNKRLMLPEGTPYLQTSENIPEAQIVEAVVVLDDVYPKTDLTISAEPETYTSETGEGEEKTLQTFYRIRYGSAFPFLSGYILPGEELHIVFTSGLLNGMDFGVRFNPKGLNEKNTDGSLNPEAQMLEIVANDDYGRTLPDDILKPKKGDSFILYGWDTTKMADLGLIAEAEQRLLKEGMTALEEYRKDTSTCTCPMAWDYMKPLMERDTQPKPGDRVTILDTAHFGSGGRESRVIGYEYTLDKTYASCTYTCGEAVSVSRLKSIERKIEGLSKSGEKVQMQNSLDFLSKRYSDRTAYDLSIGGMTHAEGGARFGSFVSGMSGAQVDSRGNAEFESGIFRSFLQIYELIVNRQRTLEGDVFITEGDTIEEVIPLGVSDEGNALYTLKLHPEWDGYTTAQYEGNVIRGVYNNITQHVPDGDGTGQTTVNNATYATSWMRVLAVRPTDNEVDVVMYPDDEVPAGRNFPPRPMMKFARWGNAGGTEEQMKRQTVLYFSSTEGRIMKRFRVTKPIVGLENVSVCIGTLPEGLYDVSGNPILKSVESGGYFETLVVQNLIQLDHQGLPKPEITFRGDYDPDADYYDGTAPRPDTGVYEWSCVVYYGCQWLCLKPGTKNPPSWDSIDWMLYLGDPRLRLEWDMDEYSVMEDNPDITLRVSASIYYQDVTDDPKIHWAWKRESWHDGVQDTASDALWNAAHTAPYAGRNSIHLVREDMNYNFGKHPEKLFYTVIATLVDKTGKAAQEKEAVFGFYE